MKVSKHFYWSPKFAVNTENGEEKQWTNEENIRQKKCQKKRVNIWNRLAFISVLLLLSILGFLA